jgi:xylulose-5-phosphate/fructose-6-phosphate phosphoketolase
MSAPASVRPDAGAADPVAAADRYWRVCCALAASHLLGATWPPPGRVQRTRVVGHWGCNPGIAWVVAHLAARWEAAQPMRLVVGTGHASSFVFAHEAIRDRLDPAAITAATRRYGAPGGDPSELMGLAGVPYSGGELGPALPVSQALAAYLSAPLVGCIVGDGECETPVALAAFAHADVLLGPDRAWLPIVNVNGARMGGPARFDARALARLLQGFGYQVLVSTMDIGEASEVAAAALAAGRAGQRVVWLSVTEKGWPAPSTVDGQPYRGHLAHKAPPRVRRHGADDGDLVVWLGPLGPDVGLASDGRPAADVVALARRVSLRLPPPSSPSPSSPPLSPSPPRAGPAGPSTLDTVGWAAPVGSVDRELSRRGTLVFSPDEADSNGLRTCLADGLVVEVLAEEVCAAWTWGAVEAGRSSVFATYEAFAPIAGSIVAQYAKLVAVRPSRGVPPLIVLATSLGWANSPTHQNTDLTAVVLARADTGATAVFPVGARSAARRVAALLDRRHDGVALLVCSKQALLDPPDHGGAVVGYRLAGAGEPTAALVAVGDVCVTEALAAAGLAASYGVDLAVLAVVEPAAAGPALRAAARWLRRRPMLGAGWAAADHLAAPLWRATSRVFPIHGYRERWGATAWETLCTNGLDRYSLLTALAEQAVPLPGPVAADPGHAGAGVPPFDCPALAFFDVQEAM